jgi:hypothetical protein
MNYLIRGLIEVAYTTVNINPVQYQDNEDSSLIQTGLAACVF